MGFCFCFVLFSYPDGWGEMDETCCFQQVKDAAEMFTGMNGSRRPQETGNLDLAIAASFLGSAYLGVTSGPIRGTARGVRYLWKSVSSFSE